MHKRGMVFFVSVIEKHASTKESFGIVFILQHLGRVLGFREGGKLVAQWWCRERRKERLWLGKRVG